MPFLRPGVTQAKTIKPREKDPAIIFMDQLRRICRISKRKAVWLPGNGIIPCEDSCRQIAEKSGEHRAAMEQLRRKQNSGMELGSMPL